MAVLVIGASSQIGYFFLPRLASVGLAAVALSRSEHVSKGSVRWLQGRLPDQVPEVSSLDGIVSFGPLADLACWLASQQRAPAPRLVAISSMSAESKRDSVLDDEAQLAAAMREAEIALLGECTRLGMRCTLIRPTLIYGAGVDKSLTPLVKRAMRSRVFPIPKGKGLRQPVHADDVATAALLALQDKGSVSGTFQLGGGDQISAEEMFRRVRRSLPCWTFPLPIGRFLMLLLQRKVESIRGPLSRMEMDLVADNAPIQDALGIKPRPFRPEASMWVAPKSV